MNVLVFAPHPDDEIIGCGGSIVKHTNNGNEVSIVYMTSGDSGHLEYSKGELSKIREKEANNSAEILGVKDFVFLRNPDGYLEYSRENLVNVINIIRSKKPEIVYVPHIDESHRDHKTTNEIVIEAIYRSRRPRFQECIGEPWCVNSVLGYEVKTPLKKPSYVENISEVIEQKLNALQKHESQIKTTKYHEAVEGLNKYRGVTSGKGDYCECFEIIKREEL